MGDFVELLIAMAVIALGILSGTKKKKKPPAAGRTSPPASHGGGGDRAGAVTPQDIERILRMEIPGLQAEPEPEPEPVQQPAPTAAPESSWQAGLHRPARTVETLERAGGASHERFHDTYMVDPTSTSAPETPSEPSMDEVRRAIIWKEILDPPVGMR